jgi:hypothetical protein
LDSCSFYKYATHIVLKDHVIVWFITTGVTYLNRCAFKPCLYGQNLYQNLVIKQHESRTRYFAGKQAVDNAVHDQWRLGPMWFLWQTMRLPLMIGMVAIAQSSYKVDSCGSANVRLNFLHCVISGIILVVVKSRPVPGATRPFPDTGALLSEVK